MNHIMEAADSEFDKKATKQAPKSAKIEVAKNDDSKKTAENDQAEAKPEPAKKDQKSQDLS